LNISSNPNDWTLEQKRETIAAMLRRNDCIVTFTKKDGTERKMKCTLKEGVAIPYEKKTDRTREGSVEILPVWDLEANGWRSINVSTMQSLEFLHIEN